MFHQLTTFLPLLFLTIPNLALGGFTYGVK
jgi:hypothetical protein